MPWQPFGLVIQDLAATTSSGSHSIFEIAAAHDLRSELLIHLSQPNTRHAPLARRLAASRVLGQAKESWPASAETTPASRLRVITAPRATVNFSLAPQH
jgi:hypothetical protein